MSVQHNKALLTKLFLGLALASLVLSLPASAQQLNPSAVPKFVDPLPRVCGLIQTPHCILLATTSTANNIDKYDVAARQFQQQILPAGFGKTTVWGFGPNTTGTVVCGEGGVTTNCFHTPAASIKATYHREVRVNWINDLLCHSGDSGCAPGAFIQYPSGVPVDTEMHWANPPQACANGTGTDCKGLGGNYLGPVPLIVHLHGISAGSESDGIPEAWNLPSSSNSSIASLLAAGYKAHGSDYCQIDANTGLRAANCPNAYNNDGAALFSYPNTQFASTLFFHDHTLGVTIQNVYMGLVGFYVLGGDAAHDLPSDCGTCGSSFSVPGGLPGGDYEIPLAIQDKLFNADGSFLLGPEGIGNVKVVNGKSWPYLDVEPRKYRFRVVAANATSFIKLILPENLKFKQIGADGGFLPAPKTVSKLVVAPGERADVIVDFSGYNSCSGTGCNITLVDDGADDDNARQVMQFRVKTLQAPDTSVVPATLPHRPDLPTQNRTRQVSLFNDKLGTCDTGCAHAAPLGWDTPVTEIVNAGDTEIWEIYDFQDSHPIHLHEVDFQVLGRSNFSTPNVVIPPSAGETGFKDTVIANGGQITRIKVRFLDSDGNKRQGLFAWHCHIIPHEDDEMMRPMCVVASGQATANAENFCAP
jgi:FtsP/CotA-like multicopper oxidase with cupredoxin domain